MLPGPQATMLAIWMGSMASRSSIGGLLAGLGNVCPGFAIMLILSFAYNQYGLSNGNFKASFYAMQPCVTAMAFRAVHKLCDNCFERSIDRKFSYFLFFLGCFSWLQQLLLVPNFITLGLGATLNVLFTLPHRAGKPAAYVLFALSLGAYCTYVGLKGFPKAISVANGNSTSQRSVLGLFQLGLLAGILSFGGAYTAAPFVQQEVVYGPYAFMTNAQFLDGLALGQVITAFLE